LSDLKEFNQTAPRFMIQKLDQNQCIHGRQQFFPVGAASRFCLFCHVVDDAV